MPHCNAALGCEKKATLTTDEHGCHGFTNLKMAPIEPFVIRVNQCYQFYP